MEQFLIFLQTLNHNMRHSDSYGQPKSRGCGKVGRAVASAFRGPGLESSHQQFFVKIKKRARGWPIISKVIKICIENC